MLFLSIVLGPTGEEVLFRGFLFRGWLRSNRDAAPVIVVTAKDLTEDDRQRLAQSAERVIVKHALRVDELRSEIRGLLPARRSRNGHGENGHSPSVNASKPPGEWQSFDITFRASSFDADGKKVSNAKLVKVVRA